MAEDGLTVKVGELDAIPWGPVGGFIEAVDADGGQVILNVEHIIGVFELIGKARAVAPDGSEARIMLVGGVNVPTRTPIGDLRAALAEVVIVAGAEEIGTDTSPVGLYVP